MRRDKDQISLNRPDFERSAEPESRDQVGERILTWKLVLVDLRAFIILFFWLLCPVLGQSLDDGYKLLRAGDLTNSRKVFFRAKGVAGEVARARHFLILGRPKKALAELRTAGPQTSVTKLEILVQEGFYSDALEVLESLEAQKHSEFPAPFRFRFYLFRGELETIRTRYELAKKNFAEAWRQAETPAQRLEVWIAKVNDARRRGDLSTAESLLEEATDDVRACDDVWVLADWLHISSVIHQRVGHPGTAASLREAQRRIHLSHKNPVRAARALFEHQVALQLVNDKKRALENCRQSLSAFIEAEDYVSVPGCLGTFYSVAVNSTLLDQEAMEKLIDDAIDLLPNGEEKTRATLRYLESFGTFGGDTAEVIRRLRALPRRQPLPDLQCKLSVRLADQLVEFGNLEEAEKLYKDSLLLSRRHMYRDRDFQNARGPILTRLANLEERRHRYQKAQEYYLEAIAVQPDADWGSWRRSTRAELLSLTVTTFNTELAVETIRANLQEIRGLEKASSRAGESVNTLANLLINQSVDPNVLDQSEKALGKYSHFAQLVLDEVLSDRVVVEEILRSCDDWYEESARAKEALIQPYPLVFKGLFLEALGRYSEADSVLRSSVEQADKGGVVPAQMLGRLILARVANRQGDFELVSQLMMEAADRADTLNPNASTFYNLVAANWLLNQGQDVLAVERFQKVIDTKPDEAWAGLYGRGRCRERVEDFEAALNDYRQAISLLESHNLDLALAVVKTRHAELLARLGKWSDARREFEAAYRSIFDLGAAKELSQITLVCTGLLKSNGDEEQAYELARVSLEKLVKLQALREPSTEKLFEEAVSLAISLGRLEEAYNLLELAKSSQLAESINLSEVEHPDAETEKLVRQIATLRKRLASLSQEKQSEELLGQTRAEFLKTLSRLEARHPEFHSLVPLSGAQLSAVQGLLSKETFLVEYFASEHALYAFLVSSEKFYLREVNVRRGELEQLVGRYSLLVSDPDSSEEEIRKVGKRLYNILVAPISSGLSEHNHLRIVPSGLLWKLPFGCLVQPNGRYLAEDEQVSYLTSSDILRILSNEAAHRVSGKVLLVGGADDLPGVKRELLALSKILPQSERLQLAVKNAVSQLRAKVKDYSVLHIATHSVSRAGESPYIELGEERLKLEQIYGLQMTPGSLVVLSSCESGVGVIGKEVTSLASAFGVAGASGVIASRWNVNDLATADFFESFYKFLVAGESAAESLQSAEAESRKKRSHPYYWAGFSLIGDPR